MAVYTENYNLILPEGADPYDVEDYNENFRAIDGAFSSVEDALAEIDTTLDSMAQKLDALAGKSSAAVKSIQTVQYSGDVGSQNSVNLSIQPVIPSRCIVIITRLYDSTGYKFNFNYTLGNNALTVNLMNSAMGSGTIQFQIVEFY